MQWIGTIMMIVGKLRLYNVGCMSSTTQTQVSIAGVTTDSEAYDKRIRMLSGDSIHYIAT